MPVEQTDVLELPQRHGQEGNRWVNYRPTGEEVAAWFASNVRLHEDMSHDDWVSGITLIQATEKVTEIAGFADDNRPIIVPDVQHLYFIPYPKVETRINYFWRLMETEQGTDEKWHGFIMPVAAPNPGGMSVGYNAVKAALPDGSVASLVCYTAKVRVIRGDVTWEEIEEADGVKRKQPFGDMVYDGSPGTKSVPILNRWGKVDENAMARAQTGANGRALGMVSMLVIPGTGVATAEDMQEFQAQGQGSPGAPPAKPDESSGSGRFAEDSDDALRQRAASIIRALEAEHPEALATFQAWARERRHKRLEDIGGAALKGVVKKLEKVQDEARHDPPAEDVPTGIDISGVEEEQPQKEADEAVL
jgi:hypothetical protein